MGHDRKFLISLYRKMLLIRQFEERVKYLFLEGVMPGTIHQYQGQELEIIPGLRSSAHFCRFVSYWFNH